MTPGVGPRILAVELVLTRGLGADQIAWRLIHRGRQLD